MADGGRPKAPKKTGFIVFGEDYSNPATWDGLVDLWRNLNEVPPDSTRSEVGSMLSRLTHAIEDAPKRLEPSAAAAFLALFVEHDDAAVRSLGGRTALRDLTARNPRMECTQAAALIVSALNAATERGPLHREVHTTLVDPYKHRALRCGAAVVAEVVRGYNESMQRLPEPPPAPPELY